jgi:hypothetical protein
MKGIGLFLLSLLWSIAVNAADITQAAPLIVTVGAWATDDLAWEYFRGPPPKDGLPTQFKARCKTKEGVAVGERPPIPAPAEVDGKIMAKIAIREIVPGPGQYECVIIPKNDLEEGPPSRPFVFSAMGGGLVEPVNLHVE